MIDTPMGKLVLATPAQLAWGRTVTPPPLAPARHIVLLAMGGSAMAARAAALAAAGSHAVVTVHQGYGLPPWAVATRALVVAISYSGATAEVLSGVHAAVAANLPLVAVSSGGRLAEIAAACPAPHVAIPAGLPPRAALGYQVAAAVQILGAAEAVDEPETALDEAADVVDRLLGGGSGPACTLGADIAAALEERVPIVIGASGPGSLAAGRWATQVEENAKRMAVALEVPEANHNAMEAWAAGAADPGSYGLVTLFDPSGDRRNQHRLDLTGRWVTGRFAAAGEVRAQGAGPLARLFSLAVVGDIASLTMAEHSGVDPMPVDALENFKQALREE